MLVLDRPHVAALWRCVRQAVLPVRRTSLALKMPPLVKGMSALLLRAPTRSYGPVEVQILCLPPPLGLPPAPAKSKRSWLLGVSIPHLLHLLKKQHSSERPLCVG